MSGPEQDPRQDEAWRTSLAPLGGEAPADPASEGRTVEALRRRGYLARRPWPGRIPPRFTQLAAALFLLLGGVWLGRTTSSPEALSPRFALLLLEDSTFQGTSSVGHDSLVAEYATWAGNLARAGKLVLGEELGDRAWPLGMAEPAATPAQVITGLFVLSVATEAEALAIARSCPHLRYGGGIVLRPIQPTS